VWQKVFWFVRGTCCCLHSWGRWINCMWKVRLRYRDRWREYSSTNEPEGNGNGRVWCQKMGQSSNRTTWHHIPEHIMFYGQLCGNLKKNPPHYIYIKLEFFATTDQRNCVETNEKYAIIFMITKTVSIDWVLWISWVVNYAMTITNL